MGESTRIDIKKNQESIFIMKPLLLNYIKTLLISNTQQSPKEDYNSPLGNSFLWCKKARGYLNEEAIQFWLQNIYLSYIDHAKLIINDPNAQALLICDSLKSHQTATKQFSFGPMLGFMFFRNYEKH